MVRIFISHSSKDKWLIDPVSTTLKQVPVEPYLAEVETPTPTSLPEKLNDAMVGSDAVFVFWTKTVADNQSTRDVVNWEISAAYHMNPKKQIYVFAEAGVSVPEMVKYVTVYATFDPSIKQTLSGMMQKVLDSATTVKENSDKAQFAILLMMAVLVGGLFLLALSDK